MNVDHLHLYSAKLARITRGVSMSRPRSSGEKEVDEAFLETLSALSLGNPFTFVEQHGGDIVQNIRPVSTHEAERSSRGRVALQLHTDDAFLHRQVRVEYIALCGVTNPMRVPTEIVSLYDVYERLRSETVEILSQPVFSFGCPESYDIEGRGDIWTSPRPILEAMEDGTVEVALPSTEIKVVTEATVEANRHLQLFKSALADAPRRQVTLEAGEILVISNSRCFHGRPAVEAERWLKRVYLRQDLTTLDELAATRAPGIYAATKAARYV
jgi:hypothetical protein